MSHCLCENSQAHLIEKHSHFYRCVSCDLVFKDDELRDPPDVEKERYKLHKNSIEDPGYVDFLRPALDVTLKKTTKGECGLDFGCGPGPTLSMLLKQNERNCKDYDPFFFPDETLLKETYDFVTCTEAAEHFYEPRKELLLLKSLVRSGGVLVIQTLLSDPITDFNNWWYARDYSHVCFFSQKSFRFIANDLGFDLEIHSDRLLSLRNQ